MNTNFETCGFAFFSHVVLHFLLRFLSPHIPILAGWIRPSTIRRSSAILATSRRTGSKPDKRQLLSIIT